MKVRIVTTGICYFAACSAVVAFFFTAVAPAQLPHASSNFVAAGDWVGRLTWKHRVERPDAWAETEGQADIRFKTDSSGGLTGTMEGSHTCNQRGPLSGKDGCPRGVSGKTGRVLQP